MYKAVGAPTSEVLYIFDEANPIDPLSLASLIQVCHIHMWDCAEMALQMGPWMLLAHSAPLMNVISYMSTYIAGKCRAAEAVNSLRDLMRLRLCRASWRQSCRTATRTSSSRSPPASRSCRRPVASPAW